MTVNGKIRHMGFFWKVEFDASMISYHRANSCSSSRPIMCFVMEIQHFVYDRAAPSIIEKFRSKDVAIHAYGVSAYYM